MPENGILRDYRETLSRATLIANDPQLQCCEKDRLIPRFWGVCRDEATKVSGANLPTVEYVG